MKSHLFLLGPPAVGKLAVAQTLSHQTHFAVYDNARAVDIAALLFPYGSPEFREFRDEQRFSFYARALCSPIVGLISTACLARTSWPYFRRVAAFLSASGWETKYIVLSADLQTLISRAQSLDRGRKLALTTRDSIESWITENWPPSIPDDILVDCIDTSDLTVAEATSVALSILDIPDEPKPTT